MPATEQTWRNQKVLHVIFGVTSLILLIATLWMLMADSNREWKGYQKQARNIDIDLNSYRTRQAEIEAKEYEVDLRRALLTASSQPVDDLELDKFVVEWLSMNERELYESLAESVREVAEAEAPTGENAEEEKATQRTALVLPEDSELPSEMQQLLEQAATQAEAGKEAQKLRNAWIDSVVDYDTAHEALVQLHTSGASAEEVQAARDAMQEADATAKAEDEAATEAEEKSAGLRAELIEDIEDLINEATFRENSLLTRLKFRRADYDAARANVDLAIRDGLAAEDVAELQAAADEVRSGEGGVEELNESHQEAAAHRRRLQEILDAITAVQDSAQEDLDDNQAEQVRLASLYSEQRATYFTTGFPYLGKKWLELPILDAFGSPLQIDNLWTEGLTINNNFTDVRRFDRCTTCHRAIEKSAPGEPLEPGYAPLQEFDVLLLTPQVRPLAELDENGDELPLTLDQVYGMQLADRGILDSSDVTVAIVWGDQPAAQATLLGEFDPQDRPQPGIMSADVITAVDGNAIQEKEQLRRYLLETVEWGKPLRISIRRGFPNPYTTHPRLELYASSMSPHPISTFACTICHEGQGSATSFDWASHTPNTVEQRNEWVKEHGWFDNHHWIYPMYPDRFIESTCLKCHHDVVDLMPSEQFPDPPAPTVVQGFELIRDYGCYGCHEINGYDGGDRIGPDMRAEPMYFAAAQQLWADPNFETWMEIDLTREDTVNEVVYNPANQAARQRLRALLIEDSESENPLLSPVSHHMAELLQTVETPGTLRKVGPSLRYIHSKVGEEFLYDWIRQPSHFRPDTKMPQIFGLLDHMQEEIAERSIESSQQIAASVAGDDEAMKTLAEEIANGDISLENRTELRAMVVARAESLEEGQIAQYERLMELAGELVDDAERYEPIEIRGIVEYLTTRSQEFEYAQEPADIEAGSREEQIARGEILFETRGCLACHQHEGFPEATATQGPDLSRMADKLTLSPDVDGEAWLYTWLLDPSNYHVRTKMPDLFLEPITEETEEGGTVTTDPAADIAAFLLADITGWEPAADSLEYLENFDSAALNDLTLANLASAFYLEKAEEYLESGVPEELRPTLKGAEVELILAEGVDELTDEQKLIYIGRRSIMKYGCAGCHDIPGFEDAKPIGTSLADWGRKESSRLAFEHILEYVGHGHGGHGGGHATGHGDDDAHGHADHEPEKEPLPEFYLMHLESHDRIGFLFQKLREPRSYDFRKNRNREFNERLRMPEFPFDNEQRQAVATFVLGLVAEPPAEQFVYTPDARQAAIIEGRAVLEKYNCAGCHMLEAEQWEIAYRPGAIDTSALSMPATYPFIVPHPTEAQLEASIEPDRQGLLHARLVGMPRLDDDGHPEVFYYSADYEDYVEEDLAAPEEVEGEAARLAFPLMLWEPTVIEGHVVPVKSPLQPIPESMITRRRPPRGGDLTHLLLPRVLELAREKTQIPSSTEAYGWLPPPLMGEGQKVQSDWLHDFLLDPYRIRPAAVMRMPRFNMSSEEATALSAYFAAVDNEQYPYELPQQRRPAHLAQSEEAYQVHLAEVGATGTRFGHSMEIVVDSAGCVKCHYVGDFAPEGPPTALAPDLSEVYNRLQPEYLRRWIAKPDWILPYTPMPENILYNPYEPSVDSDGNEIPPTEFQELYPLGTGYMRKTAADEEEMLYHGDSTAQLDALVDLLSNFDRYAREQTEIAPLVQQAGGAGEEDASEAPAEGGEAAASSQPATGAEVDAAATVPLEALER